MAVVPVLVFLFVTLWFILRGDLFYVLPCVILFLCSSVPLALRLPCLGKRANLSAFLTFVRFVLVWICRFSLPLGVWEGLRFVIVALPGLFSYLFCLVLFYSCFFLGILNFAIISLGEERERANLSAFCAFVRFALVWFCLFSLPLGVWERLQFVIVALPGLFSYLFCRKCCIGQNQYIIISL